MAISGRNWLVRSIILHVNIMINARDVIRELNFPGEDWLNDMYSWNFCVKRVQSYLADNSFKEWWCSRYFSCSQPTKQQTPKPKSPTSKPKTPQPPNPDIWFMKVISHCYLVMFVHRHLFWVAKTERWNCSGGPCLVYITDHVNLKKQVVQTTLSTHSSGSFINAGDN